MIFELASKSRIKLPFSTLQDNLLLINQVKYMHQEAWTGGKEYIVSALFKYLDADANGLLTEEELNKVSTLVQIHTSNVSLSRSKFSYQINTTL